jgi:hypothetical protein
LEILLVVLVKLVFFFYLCKAKSACGALVANGVLMDLVNRLPKQKKIINLNKLTETNL